MSSKHPTDNNQQEKHTGSNAKGSFSPSSIFQQKAECRDEMAEYAKNIATLTEQAESTKALHEQLAEKKRTLEELRKSAAKINYEGQILELSAKRENLKQEVSAAKAKLEPQLRALQSDMRPKAQEAYRAAQQKLTSRSQERRASVEFLASLETPEPRTNTLAEAMADAKDAREERDIVYRELQKVEERALKAEERAFKAEERASKAEEELRRIQRERGILASSDQFQDQTQTAESFDAEELVKLRKELADLRLQHHKEVAELRLQHHRTQTQHQYALIRARIDAVMEDRRERRALLSLPRIFDATEASSGGYIPDEASEDHP
jgi:DNA repair exonuclease SbcCD ATPase subunit